MRIILGPQGEPIEIRDDNSALAAGTDRDAAMKQFAAKIIRGPQNEIILPPTEEGICPLCGQDFPESCSEEIDDPDNAPTDDRDGITELAS